MKVIAFALLATADAAAAKAKCSTLFELNGGSTANMEQCGVNLLVASDVECAADSCVKADDEAKCCVAKCDTMFMVKGGTTGKTECDEDQVLGTMCAGATCAASDKDACCKTKTTTTAEEKNNDSSSDAPVASLAATAALVAASAVLC